MRNNTILKDIRLDHTILLYIVLYYTILYYTILYYTILYDTILDCRLPSRLTMSSTSSDLQSQLQALVDWRSAPSLKSE